MSAKTRRGGKKERRERGHWLVGVWIWGSARGFKKWKQKQTLNDGDRNLKGKHFPRGSERKGAGRLERVAEMREEKDFFWGKKSFVGR